MYGVGFYCKAGWSMCLLWMLMSAGCASPVSIDMASFDPSQDQIAIAGYYRDEAIAMRQKADGLTKSAAQYELLFGPHADLVSGARLLAQYYAQAAQELERVAESHAAVDRRGPGSRQQSER